MSIRSTTAVTDRLHIGNRWLNHAGLSLYDNTARMYDPLTVRFHTPDPLDYKRPRDSPWSHCGGNPANFIDPDGLDVYLFDTDGKLLKVTPDDSQDVIQVEGTSDEYIMPAGSIENYSSAKTQVFNKDVNVYSIQIRGDDNGLNVFEYLAENTNVEWGLVQNGVEGDSGLNFVTTSRQIENECGHYYLFHHQLKFNYTIRNIYHSHPGNTPLASKGDMNVGRKFLDISGMNIKFIIYLPKYHEYRGYNPRDELYPKETPKGIIYYGKTHAIIK